MLSFVSFLQNRLVRGLRLALLAIIAAGISLSLIHI